MVTVDNDGAKHKPRECIIILLCEIKYFPLPWLSLRN